MRCANSSRSLGYEQLEDRALLASVIIDGVSALRSIAQMGVTARQSGASELAGASSQLAGYTTAVAKNLATNSTELASALGAGNSSDVQQQTQDQSQIQNDLKIITQSQVNLAKGFSSFNVKVSQEVSSSSREIIDRLVSALRSHASSISTQDVLSQTASDLSSIASTAASDLSSLLSVAASAKVDSDSLVGNSQSGSSTSTGNLGLFAGTFNLRATGSTSLPQTTTGTITVDLSQSSGLLSGNVLGGSLLFVSGSSVTTAGIASGDVSGSIDADGNISATLFVETLATANLPAQSFSVDFTARLLAGRVIAGTITPIGGLSGSLSLVKR